MVSLMLKPNLDLIPNLTAVSTVTRSISLITSLKFTGQHHWGSRSCGPSSSPRGRRGNLHDKTLAILFPPKSRYPGLKIILSFLLLIAPLSYPSFYKNLPFYTIPQKDLPVARMDDVWFMNCRIKPIRSSDLLGWILFLTILLSRHKNFLYVLLISLYIYNREEPILTPCWICFFYFNLCFSLLLLL